MRSKWFLCAALVLVAAGCSSSSSTTINTPSIHFSRLYVSNFVGAGTGLNIFAPPFSAASTPAVSVPAGVASGFNSTGALAVDAVGRLYAIADVSPSIINIYTPPITAASVPTTSITLPSSTNAYGLALDPSGNIWVSDRAGASSTVREYTPPFTNASTPALTLTAAANGLNDTAGLAFDATGRLAIAGETTNNLVIFNPPITGASTPAATITLDGAGQGVVFDGIGRLFAVNPNTDVQVFTPPFSNAQAESFHFGAINGFSVSPKFDATGDLWVSNSGAGTVVEYSPPFSASTAPTVTLTSGLSDNYGLAFGL
jgi:hypothetical protein